MNEGNATPATDLGGAGAGDQPSLAQEPWRPHLLEKSAKLRYKNTSYNLPEEGSPCFTGPATGSGPPGRSVCARRLWPGRRGREAHPGGQGREWSNQREEPEAAKEEAARKQQQETARIDSLSNQRNYLTA